MCDLCHEITDILYFKSKLLPVVELEVSICFKTILKYMMLF